MDWFERITGFRESEYEATRAKLSVVDGRLHSTESSRRCAVGQLDTPSLTDLRKRVSGLPIGRTRTTVSCVRGDVRQLHREQGNAGALFQVASQFNLLEMVSPAVTPEHGVTRYQADFTQGPACAIAAGAGTIYRNYFASVGEQTGQRRDRQIDCLADVGALLGNGDGSLWQMRNGYCMTTDRGLAEVDGRLRSFEPSQLDDLRGRIRIGVHRDVEVTDEGAGHLVSQAYCSALPVSYNSIEEPETWARFARLVLEAAYEATLLAAVVNLHEQGNPVVYLTRLGGGAFGNDARWIDGSIRRAVSACAEAGLAVRIVSHGDPVPSMLDLAREYADG